MAVYNINGSNYFVSDNVAPEDAIAQLRQKLGVVDQPQAPAVPDQAAQQTPDAATPSAPVDTTTSASSSTLTSASPYTTIPVERGDDRSRRIAAQ